jgi:acetylornithine deacetylase/succinyl-diaminopimelate desuccinylase-like protein
LRQWAFGLAVATLLVALAPAPASHASDPDGELVADARIVELVNRVDRERALDELSRLTGDAPLCVDNDCWPLANRLTSSDELAHATDYVAAELRDLGYEVAVAPWSYGRVADRNVFARKRGATVPDELVYYVAHVDGVAACPAGLCPAADDNGSGTVAGLEIARALAGVELERTLVFMFSTGEEQGMLGARAYINDLPRDDLEAIRYLVNVDMIGWDGDGDNVIELYHGDEEKSRAQAMLMRDVIEAYTPELVPRLDPGCG